MVPSLPQRGRRLRDRIVYRADQFLAYPPIVQFLVVIGSTALVIVFWAVLVRIAFPDADDLHSTSDSLWWAVTLFSDGGTMASSPPERRVIALGVTVSGLLALSLLTGAFASKMGARIDELKSGRSPVIEKDHLIILGFDSKVTFLARELARSGQKLTVAIMATEDKEKVEIALRLPRRVPGNRARFLSRTGDPRVEQSLLRISADRARAIVIVPPSSLGDEETVHWALSTLLAVRRVVGPSYKGHVVVEARFAEAIDVLNLATEPNVAGPGAVSAEVVASDDVIARVLAQSARQEGVYFALREMLSFVGSEIYLEKMPHSLVGKTFDDAYEALVGGIVLGIHRGTGETELGPMSEEKRALTRRDRLIVLAPRSRAYSLGGKFEPLIEPPVITHTNDNQKEKVLVVGFNRTLERVVFELDQILAEGSEIRVMCCPRANPVEVALERVRPRLKNATLTHDGRRPIDLMSARNEEEMLSTDAVIVLGCEDESDDNGDASALSTLLWLRHEMRKSGREIRRVVTEVRELRSASYVAAAKRDFLVSSDVVAMLLAQSALEPEAAHVYRELLSPDGHEIFLRPRRIYVGERNATFEEVMVAARARGEVAVGLYPREIADTQPSLRDVFEAGELGDERESPVWLNPPRTAVVPMGPEGFVVVLALPHRAQAHLGEGAPTAPGGQALARSTIERIAAVPASMSSSEQA